MRPAFLFGALVLSLSIWSGTTSAAPPSYLFATPQTNYNVTTSGFTVECWIKPRAKPGSDPRIIRASTATLGATDPPSPDVWQLFVGNLSCCAGQVIFDITQSGVPHERFSGIRIDDGSYHHVAGTYDGSNMMRLFVDGVRRDSMAVGVITATIATGSLVVGNANAINNAYDGQIDELRIWQITRSESQIQASMNTELSAAPGLVASWHFNGNGVDAVASNNLTKVGDVTFVAGTLNQAVDVGGLPQVQSAPGLGAPWLGGLLTLLAAVGIQAMRRARLSA